MVTHSLSRSLIQWKLWSFWIRISGNSVRILNANIWILVCIQVIGSISLHGCWRRATKLSVGEVSINGLGWPNSNHKPWGRHWGSYLGTTLQHPDNDLWHDVTAMTCDTMSLQWPVTRCHCNDLWHDVTAMTCDTMSLQWLVMRNLIVIWKTDYRLHRWYSGVWL